MVYEANKLCFLQILKPAFPGGAGLATPAEIVSKQSILAPGRSVQTVIPQVTRVSITSSLLGHDLKQLRD